MISQQMVWIFLGEGGMERALQVPPPPRIPELDLDGFKIQGEQVRDFYEVDWTILIENIMDPDHGIFAHQFTPFDNYIASKDHPQIVEEEMVTTPTDSEPCINYKIISSVDAVEKMVARNRQRSGKADVLAPKEEGRKKNHQARRKAPTRRNFILCTKHGHNGTPRSFIGQNQFYDWILDLSRGDGQITFHGRIND